MRTIEIVILDISFQKYHPVVWEEKDQLSELILENHHSICEAHRKTF